MGSSIEQYRRMLVVNFGKLAKPAASATPEMAKPTTAAPKLSLVSTPEGADIEVDGKSILAGRVMRLQSPAPTNPTFES